MTGCRPNEAAYVATSPHLAETPYRELSPKFPWIVRMGADFTKTKIDYEWFIASRDSWFKERLCRLKPAKFKSELLVKKMQWLHGCLLQEMGYPRNQTPDGVVVNFRSIRRTHANRYICYFNRCKLLGMEPIPNPLQHTASATIRKHYLDQVTNLVLQQRQALIEQNRRPQRPIGFVFDDEEDQHGLLEMYAPQAETDVE